LRVSFDPKRQALAKRPANLETPFNCRMVPQPKAKFGHAACKCQVAKMDDKIKKPMRHHNGATDQRHAPLSRPKFYHSRKSGTPNQGDEQTVCPRHVLQIHRVHRRYAGYEAQVLDTDRYKTKEADIDQLRADGRCAKTGGLRAWGHNKRGAIVTGERRPSLSTGAALTKKAERTRPFPHSEKVMG
jgi:hypothetical protein